MARPLTTHARDFVDSRATGGGDTGTDASPTGRSRPEIGRHYWLVRRLSWPVRAALLNATVEGVANVPDSGGVILAANHLSFIDSVLLMYSLPRAVNFLGKSEYLDSFWTRTLFPAAGMIPVDRSGRGVGLSLATAAERLKDGEVVGIFPEGTRSRSGLLHRGHIGIAHMALRSGAPVVPVGIIGTDLAQPPGARVPRRGAPVTVRFGAPVDLGRWAGSRPNGTVKREVTDVIMGAIGGLSGQRYVDRFAPNPSIAGIARPV